MRGAQCNHTHQYRGIQQCEATSAVPFHCVFKFFLIAIFWFNFTLAFFFFFLNSYRSGHYIFFIVKTFLGNFFRNWGRVLNPAEMRGSVFLYFVIVSPRSFLNRLKLLLVSSFHLAIRFIKTLPAKTLLFLSHRTTNIHHLAACGGSFQEGPATSSAFLHLFVEPLFIGLSNPLVVSFLRLRHRRYATTTTNYLRADRN